MARNISHKLNTGDVEVKVTNKDGIEIPARVAILDDNRISVTADTNYTGLLITIEENAETSDPLVYLGENAIRFLTGLKNISVSYSLSGGSKVMGFMPTPNVAGFNTGSEFNGAPGLPFLVGVQDRNFAKRAADKGWLSNSEAFSDPYTRRVPKT